MPERVSRLEASKLTAITFASSQLSMVESKMCEKNVVPLTSRSLLIDKHPNVVDPTSYELVDVGFCSVAALTASLVDGGQKARFLP